MKLIALSSRVALTAVAIFVLSVAFNVQPLALFSFTAGALFLLVVAGDYAPRVSLRRLRPAVIVPFMPMSAAQDGDAKLAA